MPTSIDFPWGRILVNYIHPQRGTSADGISLRCIYKTKPPEGTTFPHAKGIPLERTWILQEKQFEVSPFSAKEAPSKYRKNYMVLGPNGSFSSIAESFPLMSGDTEEIPNLATAPLTDNGVTRRLPQYSKYVTRLGRQEWRITRSRYFPTETSTAHSRRTPQLPTRRPASR